MFRSPTPIRELLAALFLLLPFTAPVFAQASGADPELFADTVDVRVVNLEIVVEKGGDRVLGLGPGDFVLKVDGERVPIEFFTEVHGGVAVSPSAGTTDGPGAAIPALRPGESVGTRYLVFVDEVFSLPHHRDRVLRGLRDDLAFLGPEDRMAVVAYDGRSVDLLSSWTGSVPELERVLERASDRPTRGLHQRALESFDSRFAAYGLYGRGRIPYGFDDYGPYGYATSRRGERSWSELAEVVDAAASTLRAFARPEGRKVMLVATGTWPPAASFTNFSGELGYADSPYPGRDLFAPLVDTANLLGYTLYPLDAPGSETNLADPSIRTIQEASFRRRFERDREFVRESSLVELADRTGGRALLDGASVGALERVRDDVRSYYWIGFTPEWQANDRRHRITVDVPGVKRARVRVRDSFSDLSRATETSLRLESAQLFDLPVSADGALEASFGSSEGAGWNRVRVPLQVQVPLDRVTLLPTADGWVARLELRVAVTDDRGDRADIPVIPVVLEGRGKPAPGVTRTFTTELKMRERPHRVLVSLFDPATGEELTTGLRLDPEA